MTKAEDVIYAVLVAGFLSGLFIHIQLMTGYDATPEGALLMVLNTTCHAFSTPQLNNSVYTQTAVQQCYSSLFWLTVFVTVFSIASAIVVILAVRNIPLGVVLYVIGFILGFVLLYL